MPGLSQDRPQTLVEITCPSFFFFAVALPLFPGLVGLFLLRTLEGVDAAIGTGEDEDEEEAAAAAILFPSP